MSRDERQLKKEKLLLWKRITRNTVEFQPPLLFLQENEEGVGIAGLMSNKYRRDRWLLRKKDISSCIILNAKDYLPKEKQVYSKSENGFALYVLDVIYTAGLTKRGGLSYHFIKHVVLDTLPMEQGEDFAPDNYMLKRVMKMLVEHGVITRTVFNTFWHPETFRSVMEEQNIFPSMVKR